MAKHQKKPNPDQQKKLLTAQNRNDFFKRFEHLVTLISGKKETYKFMSQRMLDHFYSLRIRSPRIEPGDGYSIAPAILEEFRVYILSMLRRRRAVLNDKGDSISVYDYLTVGITLMALRNDIKTMFEKTDSGFVRTVEALADKLDEPDSEVTKVVDTVNSLAIYLSDLTTDIYWIALDMLENQKSIIPTLHVSFKISSYQQQKESVFINDTHRDSFRLGWGFYPKGMDWCMLSPELFGLPKHTETHLLSVYIQLHALQRVAERIDCVEKRFFGSYIYMSIKIPNIHAARNGKFLIEFNLFDKKVGYFVASLLYDKVVLRTFLFLTNNGTPEGQKLAELTGIQKQDKKYLALDKLSTFMDPELRQNETIRRLFVDAGCGALFELAKSGLMTANSKTGNVKAETLMKYLKLMPVEANEPPNFSDALNDPRYKNFF